MKWEAAWGKAAPWRKLDGQSQPGAKMRREAVQDYERSFEKAFDAWAATAILKTIPTKGNDHIEYNGAILELISDKEHSGKHTPVNWLRKDDFYIKYATINHDSLALAFLFTPVNRQHYAATTPQ